MVDKLSENYLALVADLQKQLTILQEAIALHSEPAPAIAKDWLSIYHEIQKTFRWKLLILIRK